MHIYVSTHLLLLLFFLQTEYPAFLRFFTGTDITMHYDRGWLNSFGQQVPFRIWASLAIVTAVYWLLYYISTERKLAPSREDDQDMDRTFRSSKKKKRTTSQKAFTTDATAMTEISGLLSSSRV